MISPVLYGQAGGAGHVVGVVDQHHVPAGTVEDRRGDRGAVAGPAVDPDLAAGHLVEALREFVQRDVQ
jgi:hypothetical protein